MLVYVLERCWSAEVDSDAVAHDVGTVKGLADRGCGWDIIERDYYAGEGLQRRERVERGMRGHEVADAFEVGGMEDGGVVEILDRKR